MKKLAARDFEDLLQVSSYIIQVDITYYLTFLSVRDSCIRESIARASQYHNP
jgi:hypothetical protein